MSYSVFPIAAMADIPSLVRSFAATLGWTTTTESATSITVTHPSYIGAKTFGVSFETYVTSAPAVIEEIRLTCTGSDSNHAKAISPILNTSQLNVDAAVVTVQPTKLHLMGILEGGAAGAGRSFIAGVIEYGYNLYRHFYLGYVDKITAFDGGEVITGSRCWSVSNGSSGPYSRSYDSREWSYPFQANHALVDNGGVFVGHANNAQSWREFAIREPSTRGSLDTLLAVNGHKVVIGGFGDSINTHLMNSAKSPHIGVQMLTPVNLYIGLRSGSTQFFQAIGHPGGARLVHMEDLEPGAQINIGTATWRVFPVFSKKAAAAMGGSAVPQLSRRFPTDNTSFYVGMAYLVSD